MCGFVGIISKQPVLLQRQFGRALLEIAVRGETLETKILPTERYAYGRLPTDGVADGDLAKIDSPQGAMLLFNGLITNTDDLRGMYGLSPAAALADQVCLREGLLAHGPSFLSHCRGMFACAFMTDDKVILARDTIGIKPLYYVHDATVFAFASELKALRHLRLPIHELLPGSTLYYDKQAQVVFVSKYTYQPYQQYGPDDLERCLQESAVAPTERYLRQASKPVGLMLSGGLDSSLLAQLIVTGISPEFANRLVAFCIGEDTAPDVVVARHLAEHLGLRLVHVRPYSTAGSLQRLAGIVYRAESPYARVAKVALLYDALAQAIKQEGIDVIVGGEGADELFYGYHRFIDGLHDHQTQELFGVFFDKVFPATLLQRYDRIMAGRLIEGRVPFLDQELVALARRYPVHHLVARNSDGHVSKLPLRRLARQVGLPPYVYNRPKEKMTAGATGRDNASAGDGYLEHEALRLTGHTFQELTERLYTEQFSLRGRDILVCPEDAYTEADAMALVGHYHQANNKQHQKGLSYAT